MAALFCLGLLVYYTAFFRANASNTSVLSRLLCITYFVLGCSAIVIATAGPFPSSIAPNYGSALFLLLCILFGISGFLRFRSQSVKDVIVAIRGQNLIELILIGLQFFAIAFFLPFALSSLTGDANTNRLDLSYKAQILGSYGILNTVASLASHLFMISIVMAFIRLSQPRASGRNVFRASLLILASLSYVVYVLAYVGRDGFIYWLMTSFVVYLIFRPHLPNAWKHSAVSIGAVIFGLMLLPLITITEARFAQSQMGLFWSVLDYFGSQIQNFSDYSSIRRPLTGGWMNFPTFKEAICNIADQGICETWEEMRPTVFDIYLVQGKAPWLFGTYVSDLVGDFGYLYTFFILTLFSFICHRTCVGRDKQGKMSAARLLLILFFFLIPYWGVFYFRFGIINSFIIINLIFIGFVSLIQHYSPPPSIKFKSKTVP